MLWGSVSCKMMRLSAVLDSPSLLTHWILEAGKRGVGQQALHAVTGAAITSKAKQGPHSMSSPQACAKRTCIWATRLRQSSSEYLRAAMISTACHARQQPQLSNLARLPLHHMHRPFQTGSTPAGSCAPSRLCNGSCLAVNVLVAAPMLLSSCTEVSSKAVPITNLIKHLPSPVETSRGGRAVNSS